jgi:outer membrane protein assembly factor BamA
MECKPLLSLPGGVFRVQRGSCEDCPLFIRPARQFIHFILAAVIAVLCMREHASAQVQADSAIVVKQILIRGNESTKEQVILREMSQRVGSVLDTAALKRDEKKIYSLQLFNRVESSYEVTDRKAIVTISVSERWYIFPIPIFGFKYRDVKKPYYGAALIHQNFRGRNEKLMASAVFGYDGWFNLAFQTPKLTDDDDVFFRAALSTSSIRNLNVADAEYDQRVTNGSVSLGKRFGLFTLASFSLGYDQWRITDPRPGRTVSSDGMDRFLTIAAGYLYDERDVREFPTDGTYIGASVVKYGLGESEVDLLRFRLDVRRYEALGDGIALGARAFGTFLNGGVSPSYLHAYFGYDERIRGHFSTVREGDNMMAGSVELRVPILMPRYKVVSLKYLPPEFSVWRYGLYAGFFVDAGTIWYRGSQISRLPWHSGYGAGLQFLLPYSMIVRTEYAFNEKGEGQFVLDFGASF